VLWAVDCVDWRRAVWPNDDIEAKLQEDICTHTHTHRFDQEERVSSLHGDSIIAVD